MKQKPANSICSILVIGIFMSMPAIGQEERNPIEIESTTKEVRDPDPSEPESKATLKPAPTALRDSTAQSKSLPKPTNKVPDKSQKQEDPLSFNFLYYIIEKFKMSDMIE